MWNASAITAFSCDCVPLAKSRIINKQLLDCRYCDCNWVFLACSTRAPPRHWWVACLYLFFPLSLRSLYFLCVSYSRPLTNFLHTVRRLLDLRAGTILPCSTKEHVTLDRESAPWKSSSRRVDAMHDSVSRTLPRHVPLIDVFIRNSIKLNRMFQKSRRPLATRFSIKREFACEGCATFGPKFHAFFSRLIV